ncbi:HD-GYP domain-containing protein [Corallincola spongiicola]|uniref:HD-GYP domain-containing protein n=1 Tax=Corallincola spongiicola TaxID=2520508 RepID=A0ABY1WQ78_9GAMM|nr:HD-GYP domain-containing protein [Corallincola spongiicola]TAA46868.1 HD-GYP domain-containing protein [Corallincola spongiicola]
MLKTISIDQLKAGMYVDGIAKQAGGKHHNIKKAGKVPSQSVVDLMRKKGVVEVVIDTDRGDDLPQSPVPAKQAKTTPDKAEQHGSASFADEMVKAEKLYTEARGLQQKALDDIAAGKTLEIKPMAELTGSFIDSVFRNQDALLCLTRIREKDSYLLEHSINVSILMAVFAKHLKLDRKITDQICLGALLHDLGKIKIAEEVLHKPGKLTAEEFQLMKNHVVYSRDVVIESGVEVPRLTMEVIIQHHEKLNGGGYPYKLTANKISKYGRMVSIVDIYDALTADRCYKRGMVPNAALGILKGLCPDQLDADLVLEFIRCMSIYPVGTLVKLESEKLGIVTKTNEKELTKPQVKVFYSVKYQHHIDVEFIDLADPKCNEKIASCEKPETHKLDIQKYF